MNEEQIKLCGYCVLPRNICYLLAKCYIDNTLKELKLDLDEI
jgi:hypothetical protein